MDVNEKIRKQRHVFIKEIANAIVWGTKLGEKLLNQQVRISLIQGWRQPGMTFSEKDGLVKIYADPRPILENHRYGRDIFRGLIIHEIGHHLYPVCEGDRTEIIKPTEENAALFDVLNMLEDEHLERNLRAVNRTWGNFLHRTAAYYIKRLICIVETPEKEDLAELIDLYNNPETVKKLHPFTEFMLLLRLGAAILPHTSRKAARAYKLIDKNFRNKNLPEVLQLAYKIKKILFMPREEKAYQKYAKQKELTLNEFEALCGTDSWREIYKKAREKLSDTKGTGLYDSGWGKPVSIEPFNPRLIRKTVFNGQEYMKLAKRVRRQADLLRNKILAKLYTPLQAPYHLSGSHLDMTAAKSMIYKKNPRMFFREEDLRQPSFFIAQIVSAVPELTRVSWEKTKLLVTFVSEVLRDLPGVEAKLFAHNMTDLFDLGRPGRGAIKSMEKWVLNNERIRVKTYSPEWPDFMEKLANKSRKQYKILSYICPVPVGASSLCKACSKHTKLPLRCMPNAYCNRILSFTSRKPGYIFLSCSVEGKDLSASRLPKDAWCSDFTGISPEEAILKYSKLLEQAILYKIQPYNIGVRKE